MMVPLVLAELVAVSIEHEATEGAVEVEAGEDEGTGGCSPSAAPAAAPFLALCCCACCVSSASAFRRMFICCCGLVPWGICGRVKLSWSGYCCCRSWIWRRICCCWRMSEYGPVSLVVGDGFFSILPWCVGGLYSWKLYFFIFDLELDFLRGWRGDAATPPPLTPTLLVAADSALEAQECWKRVVGLVEGEETWGASGDALGEPMSGCRLLKSMGEGRELKEDSLSLRLWPSPFLACS